MPMIAIGAKRICTSTHGLDPLERVAPTDEIQRRAADERDAKRARPRRSRAIAATRRDLVNSVPRKAAYVTTATKLEPLGHDEHLEDTSARHEHREAGP